MSYLGPPRSLNVQNLTSDELIDLIKNHENYSGCCRIIEEKKIGGLDILNLSENRLATWRLPQWLSKKLISLKETLSDDPESLSELEEEILNLDSRNHISHTLASIMKSRQIPKLPHRKPPDESSESTAITNEPDMDFVYDQENYVEPKFRRGPKEPKFDKPALKLPTYRGQDSSNIPIRNPLALPRPGWDYEDNAYEPPPIHAIKLGRLPSKLPLPPPPTAADEAMDVYEAPPTYTANKSPELSDESVYDYVETKKKESISNQRKISTAKFYVDGEFPPPLPLRIITQIIEPKKLLMAPPVYMNVGKAQIPISGKSPSPERKSSLPRAKKKTSTSSIPLGVSDTKKGETKTSWSTLTRPLPPLPFDNEHQSSKPKAARKEVEPREEGIGYGNHAQNKSPETEQLPEYLNTTESYNTSSKSSLINELKVRASPQNPNDRSNDSRSHISNVKQKNYHSMKAKQSTSDTNANELKEKLEKLRGTEISPTIKKELTSLKSQLKLPLPPVSLPPNVQDSTYFDEEDQPEYHNTAEPKLKPTAWRTQQKLPSPVSQFALEISQIKLKPSTPRKDSGNVAERKYGVKDPPARVHQMETVEQEYQPKHLNTAESKSKPTAWRTQQNVPSPVNQFASEISQAKLKPSTTKKDFGNFPERKYGAKEIPDPPAWEHQVETESDFEDDDEQESQPEYHNTAEPKSKPTTWRTQQNVPSPASQFALEISQVKLKSSTPKQNFGNFPERKYGVMETQDPQTREHQVETESDFEDDDEQDNLPEYLNESEALMPEPKAKKTGPINVQAKTSDLASQLAKVKLKSTPKNETHIDYKLADELRDLLRRRKGQSENIDDGRNLIKSVNPINSVTKPSENFNSSMGEHNEEDSEQEDYDVAGSYNDLLDVNHHPFYRNTDRKGAIMLLKDLEDGAFLLRPSRKFFLSITIKNKGKYFNLGIEKTSSNKIFCGEDNMRTKEFFTLKSFLEYFEHSPLILQSEKNRLEVYLKKALPPDRY